MLLANAGGVLVVVAFLQLLFSAREADLGRSHEELTWVLLAAFLALGLPLGLAAGRRRARPLWRWLDEERPADPAEREHVLRAPARTVAAPAALWSAGAVLFAALEAGTDPHRAADVGVTVLLGGITSCALTYLLAERVLRPATVLALADRPPATPVGRGVAGRLLIAWGLVTGVPLLGLAYLALGALAGHEKVTVDSFAAAVLALAVGALVAGGLACLITARGLAGAVGGLCRAQARIGAGDLEAHVHVDDASDLGLLQAGFNGMAAGLRERDVMRDLFGRHVGEEVARAALAGGVRLGGEVREVGALFVDVVGSTALAAECPAEEVAALLNDFFAVVVATVAEHGGWVNKFEGDAAVCVFGAPVARADFAGDALAAARGLAARLADEVPGLAAAVGVSGGRAVAGNVGSEQRLEYTVIGDPVNEAARLCERAKGSPGRVLASGALVARSGPAERARWRLGEEVVLRGRRAPTRLAVPGMDITISELARRRVSSG